MKMVPFCAVLVLALPLAGCRPASVSLPSSRDNGGLAAVLAETPLRAGCAQRICTQQYDPVCVVAEYEGRTFRQTFANECDICGVIGREVARYRGECGVER